MNNHRLAGRKEQHRPGPVHGPPCSLSSQLKKYLLPLVAHSELVAGRGRIKLGVNPHYLTPLFPPLLNAPCCLCHGPLTTVNGRLRGRAAKP
jgi:hypothetical protein